ncbi:hypothetical protein Ahy_A10g050383 [Arachis hypogaea]|uniref:Uncharacterized protein n=1 Tax=Arachis hypogaea TaxID=3818 RepID=A0A445B982_ARAHY|nr:hypothetical protein Ahy_A10g050383 [Arachis hypogaea]
MGLGFYMRRKLFNVHISDLVHLAEKRSKSKPFTRKEKVSFVTIESSEEEVDFETEVDLAELKKGPPYVCSLLKKLSSNEKSNDSKLKNRKKYSFDISKSDQIFDVFSGLEIVKNSKGVIICIDAILSGGIEHRLEINMPSIEDEPGVTQEEEVEEGVSIKVRIFK